MLKLGFERHVSVIGLEFVIHLYSSVAQSAVARFGSNTRERDFRGAPCVVSVPHCRSLADRVRDRLRPSGDKRAVDAAHSVVRTLPSRKQ